MSLAYLFDSNIQFQDRSGNNNVNGFLRVYIDNTDDRAVTYKDFNGTLNQADIRLDNNGRAVVIVDDSKTYRLEVYGTTGVLLWTLYPISPKATGINETLEALVAAVKSHTIAIEGLALGKKNKQQAKVISGTPTQTVKSVSQNADGEIIVEFDDIAFPHKVLVDDEDSVPKHLEDAVMADELGKLRVYVGEREGSTPENPDKVLVIDDHLLREDIDTNSQRIENLEETIADLDVDSVPHAYLGSSLYQSPGDNVSTRTTIDVFSVTAIEGDCFEFEQTTTIDDTPFGYVWIEPGTYLINAAVTLQWVGNPRGTFTNKVGLVMGENFDFSQEQELIRSTTRIQTIPARAKLTINVTHDAGTPVMGFWIKSMQVVKLAGGISQTNITHDDTLVGQGSVAEPLGVTADVFGKVKDIPTSKYEGFMALDDAYGTGKMDVDIIFNNFAGKFDPTRDEANSYKVSERVTKDGVVYIFLNEHYGPWDDSDAMQYPIFASECAWGYGYYATSKIKPNKTSDSNIVNAEISVSPGDKIYVKASLTASVKPWFVRNRKGYIVRVCPDSSYNGVVEIQQDECTLVIQAYKSGLPYVVYDAVNAYGSALNKLDDLIFEIKGRSGYYYNCSGTSLPATPTSQGDYSCGVVSVNVGDSYRYYGVGSATAVPVATLDADGNFVRKLTGDYRISPLDFTIQDGEVGFVWNGKTDTVSVRPVLDSLFNYINTLRSNTGDAQQSGSYYCEKIDTRTKVSLFCGKAFSLQCKFKYPKNYAKNPSGSKNIGGFGGVTPFLGSSAVVQGTMTFTNENEETETSYMPFLAGGIYFNGISPSSTRYPKLRGELAFSVRYTGDGDSATLSNDGTTLTLFDGVNTTSFTLSDYDTMLDLYDAVKAVSNFEFDFYSLENRTPDDLLVFGTVHLVSRFKRYASPTAEVMTIFKDASPFFLKYADDSWHTLEVFCLDDGVGKIYSAVDGVAYKWEATHTTSSMLSFDFYAQNGFVFKEVSIEPMNSRDIEFITTPFSEKYVVSSFNPINVIFEGHNIIDEPAGNATDMATSTDRLNAAIAMFKEKGYVMVSMQDILDYYVCGKPLPKRSFTAMFDDYRFEDVLNIQKRRALTSNDFKFNLAVITGWSGNAINYEGETLNMSQAIDMVHTLGGECYTHTKLHQYVGRVKFSELKDFFKQTIVDADLKNVKSEMIVYPYGSDGGEIAHQIMRNMGVCAGLNIATGLNVRASDVYSLLRVEIGERDTLTYLKNWCL